MQQLLPPSASLARDMKGKPLLLQFTTSHPSLPVTSPSMRRKTTHASCRGKRVRPRWWALLSPWQPRCSFMGYHGNKGGFKKKNGTGSRLRRGTRLATLAVGSTKPHFVIACAYSGSRLSASAGVSQIYSAKQRWEKKNRNDTTPFSHARLKIICT